CVRVLDGCVRPSHSASTRYLAVTARIHDFFFNVPATTEIYTLSLHDALPILPVRGLDDLHRAVVLALAGRHEDRNLQLGVRVGRSEEHTSELQSRENLVCRLLLEKKKKKKQCNHNI